MSERDVVYHVYTRCHKIRRRKKRAKKKKNMAKIMKRRNVVLFLQRTWDEYKYSVDKQVRKSLHM